MGVGLIAMKCKEMRSLDLSYLPVTTNLAKCLLNFSGLQSIKLDCCLVRSSRIKIIGKWQASLVELSFSKCKGLTDECLFFLPQTLKQLRKLDITCCRNIIDASIDNITKSYTSLTSLKMEIDPKGWQLQLERRPETS